MGRKRVRDVHKIDVEVLRWFLKEQGISIRQLSTKTSISDRQLRDWLKRKEMPMYLIEEICEALALESICDMRENPEALCCNCREPVYTFRLKDSESTCKLHLRIGIEVEIPRDTMLNLLCVAVNQNGGVDDLDIDDETAAFLLKKGAPAWDHYIPQEWLREDAIREGFLKKSENGEFYYWDPEIENVIQFLNNKERRWKLINDEHLD